MLSGLDSIEWAAYEGAYGPYTEAPEILRAIGSADPEAAAALALTRSGLPLPPGTLLPIATALAAPTEWTDPWGDEQDTLGQVLEFIDPAGSEALLSAVVAQADTAGLVRVAHALKHLFRERRSPSARLAPYLHRLLVAEDPQIRAAAVGAAAQAGMAAEAVADDLAQIVAGLVPPPGR